MSQVCLRAHLKLKRLRPRRVFNQSYLTLVKVSSCVGENAAKIPSAFVFSLCSVGPKFLLSHRSVSKMGDQSAYMSPGGYSAPSNPGIKSGSSGGGAGYAQEDYAWGGSSGSSSSSAGGRSSAPSNAGGGGKPKTDVCCYLGPK